MEKEYIRKSKLLSKILRHDPGSVGIELDPAGWAYLKDLVGTGKFTLQELTEITNNDEKGRYQIEGDRIRAVSGHSIPGIFPDLVPVNPEDLPEDLYHGTSSDALSKIYLTGISPMSRNYIHLTGSPKIAMMVGKRHGTPCIIVLSSKELIDSGFKLWRPQGENKSDYYFVTQEIPASYIKKVLWSCI